MRSAQSAPAAEKITPELIEAAKKEGKVTWYTSVDLALAEKVAKVFEAKYPGVAVKVERSGAERNFQRIGQEYASKIYNCDVVNSSDASHFIIWKRQKMLAAYVPEDVARDFPDAHKDPDGMFASWRITLCPIAYNTKLVKAEDAPKSFADLLDPEMDGQDGQGASGLQRRDHDRDPAAQPRPRLVVVREAFQAEGDAGPVGDRAAQEDAGRRARHHGRRRRIPADPDEGEGRSGRDRLSDRRHAADHRPVGHHGQGAQSQRGAAVPRLVDDRRGAAAQHRRRRPALGASARRKDKPGTRKFSDIKLLREEPAVVADKADEIKAQYVKYFKV